jgi:DNA topoisomerase-1
MTERGSASVLGTAISAVILLLGLMVVTAAGVVSAAFHARTAAEAAALAAVSPVVRDPLAAARGVAALNRAALVSCRCPPPGATPPVTAHVRVQTVVDVPFFGEIVLPAESSAEYVPEGWSTG